MSRPLSAIELLARLVAFDSTSRNSNIPVADFICDYLDGPGVHVERELAEEDGKVNVVVRVEPKAAANTRDDCDGLTLAGHLDVVPAVENEWLSDPFSLRKADNRYFGRGVCDMKGFVALAVEAAQRSAMAGALRRPLALILTCDEELGTLGAQQLARTWRAPFAIPRATIVGEPTSLQAVRMHKGIARLRLVVHGTSAHSAYPHLGVNAIERAARAINALAGLNLRWGERRWPAGEHFPDTPRPSLNVGTVHGGSADNIVPDRCELTLSVRILPGGAADDLIQEVRQELRGVADLGDFELSMVNLSPPFLAAQGSTIHDQVCRLVGQDCTRAVSYATDAGWLQQMGLECVVFGPGNIEVAHKPNEWLDAAEFDRAGQLLDQLISLRCGA